MAEYELYCYGESGNAYRAALMLNLLGADWKPIFVDGLRSAPQRGAEFREAINEMGEVPVLTHAGKNFSQSPVILYYLAERFGKFLPQSEDESRETLRWIIFDNQKIGGSLGPYRFLRNFAKPPGQPAVLDFLRARAEGALAIFDKRLSRAPYVLGDAPTIADISLTSYLYYPAEEFGFDIAAQFKNIGAWLDRIRSLPRWGGPYDLMPAHFPPK